MAKHLIQNSDSNYYSSSNEGNYQFTSLDMLITQFMIAYVGEDKLISRANRSDVQFYAQRAMQELSFDTFRSIKGFEYDIPNSLTMPLPVDYINYTKVVRVGSSGVEQVLYPTSKTSNPKRPQTDSSGQFLFIDTPGESFNSLISSGELIKNGGFHGSSTDWQLNKLEDNTGNITDIPVLYHPAGTGNQNEPQQGWFYGGNDNGNRNALNARRIKKNVGVRQNQLSIAAGEKYRIKFTLSDYESGGFEALLTDKNGDFVKTATYSANGTYEEVLTAGTNASRFGICALIFRSTQNNSTATVDNISLVRVGDEDSSKTWGSYKSTNASNNSDDHEDDTYFKANGNRYGLDPQHSQVNGSFYIDEITGFIHFSSNLSGQTIILKYISDSLGTTEEMQVHKFAEEAMYKHICYAILSNKFGVPEYIVSRFKKEKIAETRKAKLRLSNVKLEELTQILRGRSKWIKH